MASKFSSLSLYCALDKGLRLLQSTIAELEASRYSAFTMTETLKNILTGVGSVMDIAPKSDYLRLVPDETAEVRMRGHWEKTGAHLNKAMDRFSDEQKASS